MKEARVLRGHRGAVYVVRFNSAGDYCLTAGQDNEIRLWNPFRKGKNGGTVVQTYEGYHARGILDLDVSKDNSLFASCGNERNAYIWDVSKCTVIRKFWEHDLNLTTVKFNVEGSVLLTGSNDRFVRVFDCRSRNNSPIQKLDGFKDGVTSLTTNDHQIIAGSVDGTVRTFDIRQGEVHVDRFTDSVTCVSLSRDAKCVLTSTLGSRIQLYEASNGKDLNTYTGHSSSRFKISSCLSNTEAHVVSGSENGSIYIWGLVDGKLEQKLTPSRSSSSVHRAVCGLDYHPTKKCFLSCGHDGTASLWVAKS